MADRRHKDWEWAEKEKRKAKKKKQIPRAKAAFGMTCILILW
jgi:hypothetical protein